MSAVLASSIITGSLYTIMALGLVAIYKTTRVFNFAHGMMAAFCGYVSYQLVTVWKLPFFVGVLGGIAIGALLGFLVERLLLSRLYQRTPLELVIATFGVSLVLQFLIIRLWGHEERGVSAPFNDKPIFANVTGYDVLVVAISLAVVGLLTMVLLRTDVGLRLRATFEDPVAARLAGINVSWVRTLSWVVGGSMAGLAGVLLAPLLFLSPGTMNVILITAFAAAVIGGFSSFYGTVAGGAGVALVLNVGGTYISLQFRNLILYAVILVFLWLRPQGLLGEQEDATHAAEGERAGSIMRRWHRILAMAGQAGETVRQRALFGHAPQWLLHALMVVIVITAPAILGVEWQMSLGTWLIYFIAVAGLAMIMTYGHQFSLAQNAFMGAGAYATAWFITDAGGGWLLAIILTTLGAAAVSVLVALPSARLKGAYFAAMTLALALALPEAAYNWIGLTGGGNGKVVERPAIGGVPLTGDQLYLMVATIAIIVFFALIAFRNSPLGRRMVLASDAPKAARSIGLSPQWWQVAVLAIGGTLGGVAGSLSAVHAGIVSPTSFTLDLALLLFVAAVVGGSVTGAFWGTAIVVLVPVAFKESQEFSIMFFGLALILALFILPRDMSGADVLSRRRRPRGEPVAPTAPDAPPAAVQSHIAT
ncbi:hypothetical protein E1281_00950 [Actinomadura sp. KC345]|uniref:ABC transporter permease n=1 Tax=Actinomadura sp. KC345 TaxID=2530371 RepID=UPI0010532A7A|nr:ABC transporter permease [Actinomadura sp. KC345]TDC58551.1 hypothetical protein E1281_00950 [Actinomadura sp. KC345]